MTFTEPPKRAQTFVLQRFYRRMRAAYLGLFAILLLGPILYLFGSPFAVGLLMIGAVVGAFFFGISFGRLIETVGRRAQLEDQDNKRILQEIEASERLYERERDGL